MTWWAALAVYFIIWWTVLFCVLPLNVRSQHETGTMDAGTDPGAPVSPDLGRKAIITSVLSLVVFAVVYLAWIWTEG
jgi:predicted secreted protein